jgi:hypothetical protein
MTKAEEAVLLEAFSELQKAAEKWSALASTLQTRGLQTGRLHLSNGWILDLRPGGAMDVAVDLGEAWLISCSERHIEATFAAQHLGHLTVGLSEAAKDVQKFFYDILSDSVEKKERPRFRLQAIKVLP